jgi:hypothetical protein
LAPEQYTLRRFENNLTRHSHSVSISYHHHDNEARQETFMADPPRRRDTAGVEADRASPPRMPRWVKLTLILAAVLVLVVVIVMLIAGGGHGPSRHARGVDASPISVTAEFALSGGGLGTHPSAQVNRR